MNAGVVPSEDDVPEDARSRSGSPFAGRARPDRRLQAALTAIARGALVALAAALPFELVSPIARLGPLQLSSVEVVLYAVVAAWAGARALAAVAAARPGARAWWRRWPPVHGAAALWVAVLLASGLVAPVARGAAFKFALRSLGGVALFVAAADLLRDARTARRAAAGLRGGALLAAALMIAEAHVPDFGAVLRPFHEQSFQLFGLLRASGSFQYPNIAAMYLEAALPVVLAGALAAEDRRRAAVALAAAAVIVYAILLAASRAGLAATLVVLLGLALAVRADRRRRRTALAFLAAALIMAVLSQAQSPLLALRLRFWHDRPWYRSTIDLATVERPGGRAPPRRIAAGADAVVGLRIRNDGEITWPCDGPQPVHVAYHLREAATGDTVEYEGKRTMLLHDVPPGAWVVVAASVQAPDRPGRYLLRWDLVQERVTWFSERGDTGRTQVIDVAASGAPVAAQGGAAQSLDDAGDAAEGALYEARLRAGDHGGRPPPPAQEPLDTVPRRDLWRAALAAWREHPLLGLGPDNFRRAYARYLGLDHVDERLHANSLYMEILATLGAAGLLALIVLGAALARAAWRGSQALGPAAAARADVRRLQVLGPALGLAAYFVHGVADYFMEFTPTYGLFWLLAGMLAAVTGRPNGGASIERGSNDGPLSPSGRAS